MPGFDYARSRATAARLIGRFAQGPATLHRITTSSDGQGGTTRTSTDASVRAVRLDYDAVYRARADIPDTDARVLVARVGLPGPITLDDQITVQGARYRIVAPIRTDPADAHYDLQVRPAA